LKRVLVSDLAEALRQAGFEATFVAILFEASPGFRPLVVEIEKAPTLEVAILFEASPGFRLNPNEGRIVEVLYESQSSLKRVLVSDRPGPVVILWNGL